MSVATTRSGHKSTTLVPVLMPLYGGHREAFFARTDGTYRCGSASESEFRLAFSGSEASHCCFIREAGIFSVSRLDGRVWVNDLPVHGKNRLTDGDVISFGPVSFQLELLEGPPPSIEPVNHPHAFHSPPAVADPRPSIIPEAVPPAMRAELAEETSALAASTLRKELEEQQSLLRFRQQQLDEVAELVRGRERQADSRIASLEARDSQVTSEWNELRQKKARLETLEQELTRKADDVDRIRKALADQQRQVEVAAEQNAVSLATIEQAQQVLSHLEPELRERDRDLQTRAKSLTDQEATIAARAKALADAEHEFAAKASAQADSQSVAQLSALAAQQEAAARERQSAIEAHNKLTKLQKTIEARQLELQQRQLEIDSREDEVSSRLLTLKTYRRQLRAAQTVAVESAPSPANPDTLVNPAALKQQEEELQTEREALDRRAAEIVAKEARISHILNEANLKLLAAESERTAFHGAQKDLLCERNSLSQLRQDLASRESGIAEREMLTARKLEDMRSRFDALDVRGAELKQQESEIDSRSADVHRRVQQLKTDLQAQRESIREESTDNTLGAAIESTSDVSAIRQQLEEMKLALTATENNRESMLAERDSLLSAVRELQKALQNARQDVEDAHRVKDESAKLNECLQKAYHDLEERGRCLKSHESNLLQATGELETLRVELAETVQEREELKEKLADRSTIADDSMSLLPAVDPDVAETFTQQSRELDQRAELLDQREQDLRERDRKIVQSEGEVEAQRRQLLEARQQLELARAEIQLAMRRQTESVTNVGASVHRPSEHAFRNDSLSDPLEDRQDVPRYDSDDADPKPTTDLRSELAGLFGLRKPARENHTPPPVPQPEFMDLSEPTGENKAVAFRFGSADAQLTPTQSESAAPDADIEPARDENSDDFVRDYMEQLLSRNRKSAGGVLPGELKPTEKKSDPVAAPAAKAKPDQPVAKSGPKVKSFIEQYMAGNMGDLDSGYALTMSEDDHPGVSEPEAEAQVRPVQPRQKIDLMKLKENMESFRTLSTQSVENALASHAIKQERLGFSGRTALACVLLALSLILWLANAQGAIDAPMLTWVTLTSAIAIVSELYRRYSVIKVHTRSPLELLSKSDKLKKVNRKSANLLQPTSDILPATDADDRSSSTEVAAVTECPTEDTADVSSPLSLS